MASMAAGVGGTFLPEPGEGVRGRLDGARPRCCMPHRAYPTRAATRRWPAKWARHDGGRPAGTRAVGRRGATPATAGAGPVRGDGPRERETTARTLSARCDRPDRRLEVSYEAEQTLGPIPSEEAIHSRQPRDTFRLGLKRWRESHVPLTFVESQPRVAGVSPSKVTQPLLTLLLLVAWAGTWRALRRHQSRHGTQPTAADAEPPTRDEDYGLRIDEQVAQFLQAKQRLSYFFITAAVTVIGFVVTFVAGNFSKAGIGPLTRVDAWLVVAGSIAGLMAAGATLLALNFGHRSFALHVGYRYVHKAYEDLTPSQQQAWDTINRWSNRLALAAFILLFIEIALMVAFFTNFLL